MTKPLKLPRQPFLKIIKVNNNTPQRNTWRLILGIGFFLYGAFRIYMYFSGDEKDNFRLILAIALVCFGIYDLYNYSKKPR